MNKRRKKAMPKETLEKQVGLDFDSDGKPDLVFDLKTIILLCTMIGSVTLSYTNLKQEIEIAKTLPEYEIQNDDFNIVNQKMDYIQMEIDDMKDKIKDLEKKVYKK
jgi:cell division protein FtsB